MVFIDAYILICFSEIICPFPNLTAYFFVNASDIPLISLVNLVSRKTVFRDWENMNTYPNVERNGTEYFLKKGEGAAEIPWCLCFLLACTAL